MAKLQRYISDELTHFLGTNLESDEKRYELLIKIIQEKGSVYFVLKIRPG